MGFLTKEGLQNLTNKIVQGDAIKVASHRGKNVKEVIDNIQRECENVALPNTMTLENRVSEFKVGKGRDVDVSGDVEEGKIEVELKGKTYQNLCYSKILLNSSSLSSYEIEDLEDRIRIVKNTDSIPSWTYFSNNSLKLNMIKPNTNYTLFFRYKTSTPKNISAQFIQGNAKNSLCPSARAVNLYNDIYMANIKTYPSFENININGQVIYFTNAQPTNNCDWVEFYKDMILLEGDYSTIKSEELPQYFEGIKSSFEDGIIDVEVQGKNLLNKNNIVYNKWIDSANGLLTGDSNTRHYMDYTKIEGGRTIILSGCTPTACYVYSDIGVCIGERSWQSSFSKPQKLPIEAKYIRFTFDSTVAFENMQLEYSTNLTTYEPYYKKKISFNIEESLRSLPNGVCDEIKNSNGQWELVRRVGKLVFDGTENWVSSGTPPDDTNFKRFDLTLSNTLKKGDGVKLLCNNLPHIYIHSLPNGSKSITQECISNHSVDIDTTNVVMKASTIGGTSVTNFKQYLSNNPLVVYYELQSPIITPIDPIEFDISQGAVINISSDISPTSTHKVILNRAGQIEQSIELIANLKSRINELENIYDSNLIATQYRLNNLKLNYELEREED